LYPSKMAMAGAAAGTALLGPGLGTTVGMKAFRYTGKLFGKKKKPPRAAASQAESAKAASGKTGSTKTRDPVKPQDPAKAVAAGNIVSKPAPVETSGRR